MNSSQKPLGYRPWLGLALIVIALISFYFQAARSWIQLQGQAQGTTWVIKAYSPVAAAYLQPEVENILKEMDASMSLWQKDSTISRFNALKAQEEFEPDPHFLQVLRAAGKVHQASGGLFDPTIGPLVDLWGFGPSGQPTSSPADETVSETLRYVGWENIRFLQDGRLMKRHSKTAVDLNSLAPGYSVDLIAEFLNSQGITDFMIELGGEVMTRGQSPRGGPWVIGINNPEKGSAPDEFFRLVWPEENSLATSGNYRASWKDEEVEIGHNLDPRTGQPFQLNVLSASVLHSSCMYADAYATVAMMMDAKDASEWLQSRSEGHYLIYRDVGADIKELLDTTFEAQSSREKESQKE